MASVLCFCAAEQEDKAHDMSIDRNGEVVLTCSCGQFLKFPAAAATDEGLMGSFLAANKEANQR